MPVMALASCRTIGSTHWSFIFGVTKHLLNFRDLCFSQKQFEGWDKGGTFLEITILNFQCLHCYNICPRKQETGTHKISIEDI